MSEDKVERKVTVILATDVVGYSTKIEKNEDQTLQTLKICRALIEGLISEHHGRIFNTAGDSVLAEFPSAVEAVLCASEFQRNIKERNASIEDEAQQMEFRVGINMGDVVIEASNLYGDGVNVAARLEALAQPGGICLSKNVHEIVHKKMDLVFTDLGDQQVKNTVIHAVDVALDGVAARKLPTTKKAKSSTRMAYLVAGLAIIALLVGGGAWWLQTRPDFQPADTSKFAFKLPDKPSVAVIPFKNVTGDPTQDYIGDGLTENIITVLSASPNLMVISRNSSFSFKGKATTVQDIAEQLGVRYVLEGSIQQSGENLRVSTQLVDAVDGKHLWSERYDRKLEDLFSVQDEITQKIYEEMEIELTIGEQGREWLKHMSSAEEMKLLVQGRAKFFEYTPSAHKEAERLWNDALAKNKESGMANLAQGWLHYQKLVMRLTNNPMSSIASAQYYANKAHKIMGDGHSVALLSFIDMVTSNCSSAIKNAELAAEIDPSASSAISLSGTCLVVCGKTTRGVELLRRAIRLEPYTQEKFSPLMLGLGLLYLEKSEEAEKVFKAIIQSNPESPASMMFALTNLAISKAFKGEEREARQYVEQALKVMPNITVSRLRSSSMLQFFADQNFAQRVWDALQEAGLPE